MKMVRPTGWFSLFLALSCMLESQAPPLWAKEAPISKKTVLNKTVLAKPGVTNATKKNPAIAEAVNISDVLKRNNADFARYLFSMQPTINGTQKTQECESEFNNTRNAFDKSPGPAKSSPNPNDPANFVLCEPGKTEK